LFIGQTEELLGKQGLVAMTSREP